MTDWIALSDRSQIAPSGSTGPDQRNDTPDKMPRGLFVVELTLPLLQPAVLLHAADQGHTLSLFCDPQAGISLLHRQGATVRRHQLPGPLPQRQGVARLSFSFDAPVTPVTPDAPGGSWAMTCALLGDTARQTATGANPLPLSRALLHALATAAPGSQRHPAVLWFGATAKRYLPTRAPWIGLNTPVDTARGPVRAGLLRPGDLIATLDNGLQPLRRLIHHHLPSRGSFAPVLLCSPFFGLTTDLLVSSDQLIVISGPSVEYLYGVEEALITAAALCDGRVAVMDDRRALIRSVSLDLGAPYAIVADGCCLMSAHIPGSLLPRPALREYEAQPLLTLLGRTALRHVG